MAEHTQSLDGAPETAWVVLPPAPGEPELRCWFARPSPPHDCRGAVLVLPEVFGLNSWVRAFVERLAAAGYAALALPIFARTAPDLELGYDPAGLAEGRRHRDQVSAAGVLADARRAIAWLGQPVACVGFCFGGHLSLLVATLSEVALTCDFYGARVSSFRPGGGPPTLELLPAIGGDVLCICGEEDPLMPPQELEAIAAALGACGSARRRELVLLPQAGHGFMCDQRDDYRPEAAARGWSLLLEALAASL
ncbi:MAG: dienelactone hydrolase family protein [Cyanobacteriota bacterium]|nr:dienelactone hydrolase family protein [Cyanobacteriota bacterium]